MASSPYHYVDGFLHLLLPSGERTRTLSRVIRHLHGFQNRQRGRLMPSAWILILESSTETMIIENLGHGLAVRSLRKSVASAPCDGTVYSTLSKARIAREYGAEPTLGLGYGLFDLHEWQMLLKSLMRIWNPNHERG